MKKDSFVKDAGVLCVITLVSGLLLGGAYSLTKEPIAATNRKAVIASYEAVMPAEQYDEETGVALAEQANADGTIAANNSGAVILSAVIAKDASGTDTGYIITASSAGYGGDVKVVVGVTPELTITGISYPEALPETPGLGQKATQPDFYEQFVGKGKWLSVVKSGQETGSDAEIDAISGATITSKAVTSAVNAATEFTETWFLGTGVSAEKSEASTDAASGATEQTTDENSGATSESAADENAGAAEGTTDENSGATAQTDGEAKS